MWIRMIGLVLGLSVLMKNARCVSPSRNFLTYLAFTLAVLFAIPRLFFRASAERALGSAKKSA
jgi:hypothetical protein